MLGFVIAVLACSGSNCSVIQPEPETSYPSYEACSAALGSKAGGLGAFVDTHRVEGRAGNLVCLQSLQTIAEVEDTYEVLETVIVHSEPSANGGFVGVVENGQRVVATGEVGGTAWLRVILRDGKSGFVYGEHMRRVGGTRTPIAAAAAPAPAPPPVVAVPPVVAAQVTTPPPPQPQQEAALRPPVSPQPVPPSPGPPPVASQAPLGKGEFRTCENCPTMVTLGAGVFAMGSNEDPTEKPIHRVNIRSFAIGKFPVSVAEWTVCATAGGCALRPPAIGDADPARTPMSNLSWTDATDYALWLQKTTGKPYRLPSEAEWEYAARAGTTTRYWWGEQPGVGHADCDGCGGPRDPLKPAVKDAFPANPWGLFGMGGGVAQWTDDCWHLSYLAPGVPSDGGPWRSQSCTRHVLRGGSWKNPPSEITVSNRNFYDTGVRYVANGLRVAVSGP